MSLSPSGALGGLSRASSRASNVSAPNSRKKKKKNFGKNGGGCNVSQRVAGSNGYEFFHLQALLTSSRCLNQSYDIYVVLWLCLEVVWTTEDLNPLLSLRRF